MLLRPFLLLLFSAQLLHAMPRGSDPCCLLSTDPSPVIPGSFVWLTVRRDPADAGSEIVRVDGALGDAPLHFDADSTGAFRALAGIPIDVADTLWASLDVERRSGAPAHLVLPLVPGTRTFGSEQLRVAPSLARPDSAAQARIAHEIELAHAIGRRSHDTARLWSDGFRPPRTSRVTSTFGRARVYNGDVTSRHMGTDYAGAIGAPVRAPARGVVALVAEFYLAGRVVYLDHGEGVTTGYFHLSEVTVTEGDTVVAGTMIGKVGRSGRVTGPHLHWVARYGTVSVDPMTLPGMVAARR